MADWEEYAPLAVAGLVLGAGVIWAVRSRPETRTEAVIAQPQPIDVGAIVGAQASLAQARLAAGTQIASEYMQTILAREQAQLQARIAAQQLAATERLRLEELRTQERIAQIQAEAAKAQIQAQLQAAQAQAAAQQQASFWNFLGGVFTSIIPFLFSRHRTEQARLWRLSEARGIRAQVESTRSVLQLAGAAT